MAERSLAHARAGIYPNGIESEVTPERLARFFDKDDGSYRVRRDLRELLVFAPQNVLEDPPFSRMDICSCRNLLIYLEPETQRKLLLLLHFGLIEGGALMLGTSETTGRGRGCSSRSTRRPACSAGSGRPGTGGWTSRPPTGRRCRPCERRPGGTRPAAGRRRLSLSVAQLTQRALVDLYTPASVVVDRDFRIVYFHGKTEPTWTSPGASRPATCWPWPGSRSGGRPRGA